MRETFDRVKPYLLAHEGGYIDHPRDPGGATNMGITRDTLSAWRGQRVSKLDVKHLTRSEALQIYKAQYWDKVMGDELPAGLDYALYDFAVNSGPARAVKYLQAIVGVGQDGIMGAITLNAVRGFEVTGLINRLCDARLAFMRRLSTWSTFGKGWRRRVSEVRGRALSLVSANPMPAPGGAITTAPMKAVDADTKATEVWKTPEGVAVGLSGISGLASSFAHSQVLQYVLAGVLVAGLLVGATFFLKRLRRG